MSFLSGLSIKKFLSQQVDESDRVLIFGMKDEEKQIGPCSIDLRLSDEITRFKKPHFLTIFDLKRTKNPNIYEKPVQTGKGFIIEPGELILAKSEESIKLPKNMFGLITGRSTFSRLGIEVQLTQDLLQPGRFGVIPFQIKNNSPFPIRLYSGTRIAQLLIGYLDQECEMGYDESPNAKYKNETGIKTYQYKGDNEVEDKQFEVLENKTNPKNYLKNGLNLLLIVSLVLLLQEWGDIKSIISGIVLILILIVRTVMFIKGD
jgi:dCTP deaminase